MADSFDEDARDEVLAPPLAWAGAPCDGDDAVDVWLGAVLLAWDGSLFCEADGSSLGVVSVEPDPVGAGDAE